MKKVVLIFSILIATSTNAFCAENLDKSDKPLSDKPDKLLLDKPILDKPDKADKPLPDKSDKPEKPKIMTLSEKAAQVNLLNDDKAKIKEWAKFTSKENYLIIDKKNCCATVYDKNGNEIDNFEVGIGREIGDDFNDTSGILGKPTNTTPAGEYTLDPNIYNKAAYGDLTLSLGKKACKSGSPKQVVALHKIPKFRLKERLNKFYDGNLANNRMSHGCINFIEKDFKELTQSIHGGSKTYILPEEKGNKLILEKNSDGEFQFVQAKY